MVERGLSVLQREIEDKLFLKVPLLHEDKIESEHNEVSGTWDSFGNYTSVKATKYTFFIPFSGNEELLWHESLRSSSPKPEIDRVERGQIIISITKVNAQAQEIKEELERKIKDINIFLSYVEDDIEAFYLNKPAIENNGISVIGFNPVVTATAQCELEKRQAKLQKDEDVFKKLGYPLKRKESTFPDYTAVPSQRKIQNPLVQQKQAEPLLSKKDYEDILFILSNMSVVMERCPEAFVNINEEALRQHFLVQLNGLYTGQATGETFNFGGKTDILIRADNKNVFIAECKFWKGEKAFKDTINQLLGYLSWRDTKTAIIIFNRNLNFSDVLRQIQPLVESHPNYKRNLGKPNLGYNLDSAFQFILHHNGDASSEVTLTVMVFNVPTKVDSQ